MDRIDVVAAAISDGVRVFAAQKASGPLQGLWEFPGGKVEPQESHRVALMREVREELSCEIAVGDHLDSTDHDYDFVRIRLHTYWCRLLGPAPVVTEHSAGIWVELDNIANLAWAPADLEPVALVKARIQALSDSAG